MPKSSKQTNENPSHNLPNFYFLNYLFGIFNIQFGHFWPYSKNNLAAHEQKLAISMHCLHLTLTAIGHIVQPFLWPKGLDWRERVKNENITYFFWDTLICDMLILFVYPLIYTNIIKNVYHYHMIDLKQFLYIA